MPTDITNVTNLVQLALTPAFLLSGIGAILAVLSGRLSRVVDRTHRIHERIKDGDPPSPYHLELNILNKRSNIIHHSFLFGSISGFCICGVITLIYVGEIYSNYLPTTNIVGWLFGLAMLSLTIALFLLVQEIKICSKFIQNLNQTRAE